MKKRAYILFLIIFAAFVFSGCGSKAETDKSQNHEENTASQTVKAEYHVITAEEAKKMMDEKDDCQIIDVRTKEEYDEGHIVDAINIPNEVIREEAVEKLKDKDQLLLIYCHSGRRSKEAANKLVELGYSNVYDFGGIIDWNYGTEN